MQSTKESISPDTTNQQTPSTTTTFYQHIASQLMGSVNVTVEQIPGYHDDLSGLSKRARRLVTNDFLAMSMSAVEASEELTGVKQLDVVETRDSSQFSEAFRPLADHLLSVVRRLNLMMKAKDVKAGRNALSIYHIAQRLVKNTNNTHMAVYVANLKAELKRKRSSAKSKAPAPVTSPPSTATPEGGEGGEAAN